MTDDTPAESFEARMDELEKLVEQLESGDLELADSLDRFRRGIELSRQCREMLDAARNSVEELSAETDSGASADPETPGETSG